MNEPIRAVRDPEDRKLVRKTTNSKDDLGKTTWKDIALGIYVGGIALAITGALFSMFMMALFAGAIRIH